MLLLVPVTVVNRVLVLNNVILVNDMLVLNNVILVNDMRALNYVILVSVYARVPPLADKAMQARGVEHGARTLGP